MPAFGPAVTVKVTVLFGTANGLTSPLAAVTTVAVTVWLDPPPLTADDGASMIVAGTRTHMFVTVFEVRAPIDAWIESVE